MPADQRPEVAVTTSRRSLLRAAAGVPAGLVLTGSLSGCGLRLGQPDGVAPVAAADPDLQARDRVADEAQALAASARRAARVAPHAARQLAAVAADHDAHVRALRPVAAGQAPGAASPTASPSTSPTAGSSAAAAPTPAAALAQQAAAERAARTVVEQQLAGVSGDLARLLASVAADRAVHAETLSALSALAVLPAPAGSAGR